MRSNDDVIMIDVIPTLVCANDRTSRSLCKERLSGEQLHTSSKRILLFAILADASILRSYPLYAAAGGIIKNLRSSKAFGGNGRSFVKKRGKIDPSYKI